MAVEVTATKVGYTPNEPLKATLAELFCSGSDKVKDLRANLLSMEEKFG